MARSVVFHARFETLDDGWIQARIDELPAVITAGRNQEEAREFLVDALREYLLSLADAGQEAKRESRPSTSTAEVEIVLAS